MWPQALVAILIVTVTVAGFVRHGKVSEKPIDRMPDAMGNAFGLRCVLGAADFGARNEMFREWRRRLYRHGAVQTASQEGHEVTAFDRYFFGKTPDGCHVVRGDIRTVKAETLDGHDAWLILLGCLTMLLARSIRSTRTKSTLLVVEGWLAR